MYKFDRQEYDQRMAWYTDARFGMFIHWGLYAIPAREKLGWAKYAAAEEYASNYAAVRADMEREIAELIRKAGEEE